MKKEELDNSWEEVIFNGFIALLFIFIFGYVFLGLFKGLETSLENTKQTGILRSAYENNEGTDYVLDKTIYLKSINMDIVNTTHNKKTGNSKIGKFFVQNIEEETSESKTKEEFYYFAETKNGIQKKSFKEETGEELTSKNVFFKEISDSEQPKIEVKTKEFSKGDVENERRSAGLEEKSYTIYLHKDDFNLFQK